MNTADNCEPNNKGLGCESQQGGASSLGRLSFHQRTGVLNSDLKISSQALRGCKPQREYGLPSLDEVSAHSQGCLFSQTDTDVPPCPAHAMRAAALSLSAAPGSTFLFGVLYNKCSFSASPPPGFLVFLIHHLAGTRARARSLGITAKASSWDGHPS